MKSERDLRDEFAGRAMQGLLSARCPDALNDVEKAAQYAYDYADALIKEGNIRQNNKLIREQAE